MLLEYDVHIMHIILKTVNRKNIHTAQQFGYITYT